MIPEIVCREIDPVLFIHLLTTDNFLALSCTTEHWEIVTYLTQLITNWSNYFRPLIIRVHPAPTRIQVRQPVRSLSVPVAEHDRTYGWIRPKR